MLDNAWVRLTNNWLHDVATGLWAACLIVMLALQNQQPLISGAGTEAWHAVGGVALLMFQLMLAALVVIVITGAIRLVYWRRVTPPAEMPAKRKALIGKHVAFVLVYGVGTLWAYTLLWP